MRGARILLALAGLALLSLAAAGPAGGAHCNGRITVLQPTPQMPIVYFDDRDVTEGGVWVYQEANGVPGLQSGGGSLTGLYGDPCTHAGVRDRLLF